MRQADENVCNLQKTNTTNQVRETTNAANIEISNKRKRIIAAGKKDYEKQNIETYTDNENSGTVTFSMSNQGENLTSLFMISPRKKQRKDYERHQKVHWNNDLVLNSKSKKLSNIMKRRQELKGMSISSMQENINLDNNKEGLCNAMNRLTKLKSHYKTDKYDGKSKEEISSLEGMLLSMNGKIGRTNKKARNVPINSKLSNENDVQTQSSDEIEFSKEVLTQSKANYEKDKRKQYPLINNCSSKENIVSLKKNIV